MYYCRHIDYFQLFNEPKDLFPSDSREETDGSQQAFLMGDHGESIPVQRYWTAIILFAIAGGIDFLFSE